MNIFLARTEKIRQVGYDPNIRVIDHHEFFYRAAGKIVCVIDPEAYVFHCHNHFEKEDYPFLERYNVNRTENSKFMAFLKAIIPNKNQSRVVCYKFDRNYKYIGKTTLPKDVSIENVLRLHRNGTLKDFHYSKKFE
jgi:hypothetical protein